MCCNSVLVREVTGRARAFAAALLFVAVAPCCFAFSANDSAKQILSDGSLGDTQAAVSYVVGKNADGWVLTVGTAGASYSWSGTLSLNLSHVFTVQGASPTNRPSITATVSSGNAIGITCVSGKTVTIKDLVFNEWQNISLIFIGGSGVDCFRLTNMKFNHSSGNPAVSIGSLEPTSRGQGPYGLIDHCEMTGSASGYGFFIRENQQPEVGFTPGSWGRPMSWGTKQAVYIEDCNFHYTSYVAGRPALDGDNGGRVVFRHNQLSNQNIGTHGADSPGPVNSILQCEVMHNSFSFGPALAIDTIFFLRGGSAAISDNTWSVPSGSEVHCITKMLFYRAFTGNNVIQDRVYPKDYVGTQQPGSGVVQGAGADPNFPTRPWGSVPVYSWGNHPGGAMAFGEIAADSSGFESANRDYFIGQAMPGYSELVYPHPLQAGVSATSIAPPSNLSVSGG